MDSNLYLIIVVLNMPDKIKKIKITSLILSDICGSDVFVFFGKMFWI